MRRKTYQIPPEAKLAGGFVLGTGTMALIGSKLPGAMGTTILSGAESATGMAGPVMKVASVGILLRTMKHAFPIEELKFKK